MLENPLHISLPLHDVHLLWNFEKSSGATSLLVDNEMMPETTESPVQTQHLDFVILKPDCIQEVRLHLLMYAIVCMYFTSLPNFHLIHIRKYISSPC